MSLFEYTMIFGLRQVFFRVVRGSPLRCPDGKTGQLSPQTLPVRHLQRFRKITSRR